MWWFWMHPSVCDFRPQGLLCHWHLSHPTPSPNYQRPCESPMVHSRTFQQIKDGKNIRMREQTQERVVGMGVRCTSWTSGHFDGACRVLDVSTSPVLVVTHKNGNRLVPGSYLGEPAYWDSSPTTRQWRAPSKQASLGKPRSCTAKDGSPNN